MGDAEAVQPSGPPGDPAADDGAGGGAEVVRELSRRFNQGDRDGAFELLHPEFRLQQPASLPHGGWHHGRSGMEAMGATFARHWDRSITDTHILGCGEVVLQVTTQTWTSRRTGRSATVDVAEIITVAGGRILEIRVFQQDTHLLLATLDAPTTPPVK